MQIHTVSRGDSVFTITRHYGIPPTRLITDNLLEEPGKLAVGQGLLVLFPTCTHTVRGGETLASIAAAYDRTLLSLYQYNPQLFGSPQIFPGQVLNIAYAPPQHAPLLVHGYAYPTIDRTLLRQTLPYLTYLSLCGYSLRPDGSILPPAGNMEELFALARAYGTVPLPVLSQAQSESLSADEDTQAKWIENAVKLVREGGCGGVVVAASSCGRFVERLQAALGEQEVFLPYGPEDTGSAAHTLVQARPWGHTYDAPGTVSPLPEVCRVLDAVVAKCPPEKLLLGMPNYGMDWPLPYVRGKTKARVLDNGAAVAMAWEKEAAIGYDSTIDAPTYRYYDRPSTFRDAIEHVVWFQDPRSTLARLSLLPRYGIPGISVWDLMRPYPALWTLLMQNFGIQKKQV